MINWIRIGSAVLFLGAALTGCEQRADAGDVEVHPRIVDRPDREQVELYYTNDTRHTLCLNYDSWPTSKGKIYNAGDLFALVVGGRRFPMENHDMHGYCIGEGCVASADPGATIFGFLSYNEFRLPIELRYEPKQLEYSMRAYSCDATNLRPKLKPK